MNVHLVESETELPRIAEVLIQLRPQYDFEGLIQQIKKQQASGYQIAYVESDGNVLCVAGFVIAEKLAWGKHVYIDDLVTNEYHRSTGVGQLMIDWFKAYCKAQGCDMLHLDSGVQRFAAHRFYLANRFIIGSHHFSMSGLCS